MTSAVDNTPENKNFLSPLNYKFQIKRSPHVNFFTQKVNLPGFRIPEVISPNPLVRIPYSGEHILFEDLEITFKVDEDLQNYLEIYNWLTALGKPENFQQYAQIQNKKIESGEGLFSDISLTVLNSSKLSNYEFIYIDAFPISISKLNFNSVDTDVNYMECSVIFKYTYFNVVKI